VTLCSFHIILTEAIRTITSHMPSVNSWWFLSQVFHTNSED
jgi:hypothetical protein